MIIAKVVFKRDAQGNIRRSITRPFSVYADIKAFRWANKDTVLKVVDRQGALL